MRSLYTSGLILVLELDAGARFGPISQDAVDHIGKGRAAEPDLQRKRSPARLTPPATAVLNIARGQDMAPARCSNNEHGHCVRRYSEYPFVSDTSPSLRWACAARVELFGLFDGHDAFEHSGHGWWTSDHNGHLDRSGCRHARRSWAGHARNADHIIRPRRRQAGRPAPHHFQTSRAIATIISSLRH